MKYVALLRAANVGGRNIMSMAALTRCLEQVGLTNVSTVTQSGNVIFESSETDLPALTTRIERAISTALGIEAAIVLLSHARFRTVIAGAPRAWTRGTNLRRNIAFLRPPATTSQALKAVTVKPGIDSVKVGKGVVYMATAMSGLQKSGLRKLIGTPVYREMTIRTYGTCQKILALMED